MAPLYTNIDALVTNKTTQAIKVRCVRVYNRYVAGSKSEIIRIECVVHDEQGTRIQLSVPNKLTKMFGNKLKEGLVYQIMNFMVKRNGTKWKVTDHVHRLELTPKTMISEVFPKCFPNYKFSFKSFEDISSIQTTDSVGMFDVIGVIAGKGFVKNDSESKMVELKLEDQNHNQIYCTLWEDYVDMFLNQADAADTRVQIIIIQLCRPNFYRGEMRACTSYNASQIFLNSDIPEIEDFRKQIIGNQSFSARLELSFEKSVVQTDDFFNGNIVVKTLDDIFTVEDGEHWICAKIDNVDCYAQWCYNACRKCTRKVEKKTGRFYCGNCDKYDGVVNKRYQLILNVVDCTNNASLLVWDKEAVALVGKKAVQISMNDKEAADAKIVPKEIDVALNERVVMFKIQMRSEASFVEDKPYTVTKVCTDQLVINHFWKENDVCGLSATLEDLSDKGYLEQCESLSQISDITMAGDLGKDYGDGKSTPMTVSLAESHVLSKISQITDISAAEELGKDYGDGLSTPMNVSLAEVSMSAFGKDGDGMITPKGETLTQSAASLKIIKEPNCHELVKRKLLTKADICGMSASAENLFDKGYLEDCESLSHNTDVSMATVFGKDCEDGMITPKKVTQTGSDASSKIIKEPKCHESVKRKLLDDFTNEENDRKKKARAVKVKIEKN
ncbi:uncharacterized protein LOC131024423 isoform X2 [Salvia miltiorrhiza]|uniref:uncharacterized protein LOC130985215 isoform X2 n=2 Tax=Salvia miltiorrhiza TaxID=226208 RepID=UPI0025ACDD64|nr:uncharacterized protein LOC130985215 isoform X2 [Salvia miltiorrhiza]XP_057765444.1 uncharacterized protein LOC130986160 isoform X2 [Salvia miltiorrhiza]XP_057782840.1 uncharacterized protein LOC131000787 isoform X2 [Salvia miltiorrhiza]XP_057791485.1 uncharacterized protein LOC131008574 isoform X2 [Salvia miltiorrhiza]XP_057809917.1 uncharacterized protein LOC131024423 isoform X2 [Salvia miltiorrhiza]